VTLSLKNMFGAIPGSVYGWPKNVLHWKGIEWSILDINSTMPVDFVIADGIVAMEGNGPLHGTARNLGRIVMSDDPVAADFTCARLMGLDPYRISHLAQAAPFLGNGDVQRIEQLGERLPLTVRPFSVLPEFAHLIAGATSRPVSFRKPHYVHNGRGAQIRTQLRFLAYAVDCDQASALWRLVSVRLCQFARPEPRLAAIAGPHAIADMAQNSTGRAVRAAAQHRNHAGTGRDRQRLTPHDDGLLAKGKEHGRCRSITSWPSISKARRSATG
jgi:hypothetical protein